MPPYGDKLSWPKLIAVIGVWVLAYIALSNGWYPDWFPKVIDGDVVRGMPRTQHERTR